MTRRKYRESGERGWQALADRFESRAGIGLQLGVSQSFVSYVLKYYNVECQDNPTPYDWIAKYEGFENKKEMFQYYYHTLNVHPATLGSYFGLYVDKNYSISRGAIQQTIRRLGIKMKPKGGSRYKLAVKTLQHKEKIKKLDYENMTLKQIEQQTELTHMQVYNTCRRCQLKYKPGYNVNIKPRLQNLAALQRSG